MEPNDLKSGDRVRVLEHEATVADRNADANGVLVKIGEHHTAYLPLRLVEKIAPPAVVGDELGRDGVRALPAGAVINCRRTGEVARTLGAERVAVLSEDGETAPEYSVGYLDMPVELIALPA